MSAAADGVPPEVEDSKKKSRDKEKKEDRKEKKEKKKKDKEKEVRAASLSSHARTTRAPDVVLRLLPMCPVLHPPFIPTSSRADGTGMRPAWTIRSGLLVKRRSSRGATTEKSGM